MHFNNDIVLHAKLLACGQPQSLEMPMEKLINIHICTYVVLKQQVDYIYTSPLCDPWSNELIKIGTK